VNVDPSVWVPITSAFAFLSWVAVVVMERDHVRNTDGLPAAVREASLVAVLAASGGGTIASLGWVQAIGPETSAFLAIAWRAAVLACGVYAIIGSAVDGRAE